MKGVFNATFQGSTGPGMAAEVERVLVALHLVFVLEAVVTYWTHVLLLEAMVAIEVRLSALMESRIMPSMGPRLTGALLGYQTFWVSSDNIHTCGSLLAFWACCTACLAQRCRSAFCVRWRQQTCSQAR